MHVYDFDSGEAHAVVSYYNRTVHRARGTVRQWTRLVAASETDSEASDTAALPCRFKRDRLCVNSLASARLDPRPSRG